jgi:hypothetical protein
LLYLERRAIRCITQYDEYPNNLITNALDYASANFIKYNLLNIIWIYLRKSSIETSPEHLLHDYYILNFRWGEGEGGMCNTLKSQRHRCLYVMKDDPRGLNL